MTAPTPAALRMAMEITVTYAITPGDMKLTAKQIAEIIDREGLREATEALRAIIASKNFYMLLAPERAIARAALARLEAK